MKKIICTLFLLVSISQMSFAQTRVYGDITHSSHWKIENSPYIINSRIRVLDTVTLTIDSGSVVLIDPLNGTLDVRGTLIASGVVFVKQTPLYSMREKPCQDSLWYGGTYYSTKEYHRLKDEEDRRTYETWFMPGIGYSMLFAKNQQSEGNYRGAFVQYTIYSHVRPNENPGPSHLRFYSKLSILNNEDNSSMFQYGLGLSLSLERNPKREYFIPYFGLEFGGMKHKNLGNMVQFTPTFGLEIISKENLQFQFGGGYMYPSKSFEDLQGWTTQAGIIFSLW